LNTQDLHYCKQCFKSFELYQWTKQARYSLLFNLYGVGLQYVLVINRVSFIDQGNDVVSAVGSFLRKTHVSIEKAATCMHQDYRFNARKLPPRSSPAYPTSNDSCKRAGFESLAPCPLQLCSLGKHGDRK
jgi:hypothetical protein